MNYSLYHYGRSNVAADVPAFRKASDELDRWIDEQKPKLVTEKEKAIMQQIAGAYDGYRRTATELLAHLEAIGLRTATVDRYTAVQSESLHLFDLVEELARAHLHSRDQLLSQANHALTQMRTLVLSSLGLLFLFALALSVVIYRDMIVPLRVKLVESESLRERQEKFASLGVLAAGVAHEIRNPLTAIKAALFIQQKRFQPGSQEASDSKVIDREILRLERIVNDFLLFARPSDSHLAPMTADAPLREVHALLSPQLAKANIQLVLEDAPSLPLTADEEQIKQVLINLVRNAADAIGENGVVKLRGCSGEKIIDGKETRVAILEVEDNGNGIPQNVLEKILQPFFTTKPPGQGTGLGLSLSYDIV
ncbi:MAG: hypothetical protein H8M99_01150, partial [Gloeobacteraceae cyanobacterium ES-bin-144]|nr:hypothetical protein [Verrucomicrobiales bacterium]